MYRIRLGQEVRDNISGFRGIATCRCLWLHGCERIVIQPPMGKKDTKLPETGCFDEPQLEIIGEGVLVKARIAHGDNSFVPSQH